MGSQTPGGRSCDVDKEQGYDTIRYDTEYGRQAGKDLRIQGCKDVRM